MFIAINIHIIEIIKNKNHFLIALSAFAQYTNLVLNTILQFNFAISVLLHVYLTLNAS